ncbi:hypothetical protein LCGC14_1163760 [marine sediment metagenome]|uniref:Radical SAM core domain-containing protein n=1 Tax=marine sediment metagenome TaxID=412755 RepID=A0A0F9PXF7_9ZZZZ
MNLLINPPAMIQSGYTPPPLGLLYLAAMDAETEVYDAALYRGGVQEVLDTKKPRVVGVPIYTAQRHDSLDVLRAAKAMGAITVAGGPHVAVMTGQLVEYYGDFIDHFVVGDGEMAWKQICHEGQMAKVKLALRVTLDDLPLPAWEKVDLLAYPARGSGVVRGNDLAVLPRISIVLGRGCTGHCSFCSSFWVNGKYRCHSTGWMERNLDVLWGMGVRHLVFQDDCLTADKEAVLGLCELLAKDYWFSWHATTRVDCFSEDIAAAMKNGGCYEISFGIESSSPSVLKRMQKEIDPARAFEARDICRRVGIRFTALMMSGYPSQTPEMLREDKEFLRKLQPDGHGTVGSTWVLPGTALYRECKNAGLLDDDFWLGPEPYYIYQGGLS